MVRITALLLGLFWMFSLNVKGESPKREMRAVWFTTVWGLDWPGSTTVPVTGSQTYRINEQKNSFINHIDGLAAANINTIFFQIRSECDAFYPSSYEPWSSYLVSDRRMASDFTLEYDPLQFVIDECHARGIEVHAWMNPYRFESVAGKYAGKAGDYNATNPDWVLNYPNGGAAILDPGNPEVRQRIVDIVSEVVTNYDVDGVVFDDYFYAYGGTPNTLDQRSQNLYKPAGKNLDDWRRENVNKMVADVYGAIQNLKPWVTFGLSPFGIWTTNKSVAAARGIPLPEGITGGNMYQEIYCDPVAWLEEGTVDYVSPQLYWPTTNPQQDYRILAPWWSNVANQFGKHFYSSHTLSALEPSSYAPALKSTATSEDYSYLQGLSMIEYQAFVAQEKLKLAPTEYGKQIHSNRISDINGAPGSVFFRANQFKTAGFANYLKANYYKEMALPPAINWKSYDELGVPTNLNLSGETLEWDFPENDLRYVVYAIPNGETNNPEAFNTNKYIIGISYEKSFSLSSTPGLIGTHTFAVSVMDRFGNEFAPAMMGHTPSANEAVTLTHPENSSSVEKPFSFSWSNVAGATHYILEVAEDSNFENIVYGRELTETSFSALNISSLKEGEEITYYWRVKTRKVGVVDAVSVTHSFLLLAAPSPDIVSPVANAVDVEVDPLVSWNEFDSGGYTYNLQLSTNENFTTTVINVEGIGALQYQIAEGILSSFSTYYLRLSATKGEYTSAWSEVVAFSTFETPAVVPVITSPSNGAEIANTEMLVTWEEDEFASLFHIELSPLSNFPIINKKIKTATDNSVIFDKLKPGTYYLRAKARYGPGLDTEWSPTISFSVVSVSVNGPENALYSLSCPTDLSKGETTAVYELPSESLVKLYLTDLSGSRVMRLVNERKSAGKHQIALPSGKLSRGIYLLTIESEFGIKTVKVIKI